MIIPPAVSRLSNSEAGNAGDVVLRSSEAKLRKGVIRTGEFRSDPAATTRLDPSQHIGCQ
jgi:hypothetical protein